MTITTQPVYKCDFCKKYYIRKYAAETHEKYCGKNPANWHTCLDCVFLSVDRQTTNDGFNEKTFTCTKKDLQLHTFKAERIKHSCLGYTERMPLQCSDHKTEVDKYFEENKGYDF
jgi:hypothetical protein